jgi:hypothetical protein
MRQNVLVKQIACIIKSMTLRFEHGGAAAAAVVCMPPKCLPATPNFIQDAAGLLHMLMQLMAAMKMPCR